MFIYFQRVLLKKPELLFFRICCFLEHKLVKNRNLTFFTEERGPKLLIYENNSDHGRVSLSYDLKPNSLPLFYCNILMLIIDPMDRFLKL